MDLSEIIHRLHKYIQVRWEKMGLGLAQPSKYTEHFGSFCVDSKLHGVAAEPYCRAADRILSGAYDFFALEEENLGFPPTWNQDPKTKIHVPLVFGKTLNYRDEQLVGNIKYLWEPNRHLELVTIAQAWHLTGDDRYREGCAKLLDSWFEQCPYPLGINWTSSLELGVRLMNWAFAWHLIDGANLDGAFRSRWLNSIFQHCHFISGHLSKNSSANNHLIGEYAGLYVASAIWPCWKESIRWKSLATIGLEEEALKQNASDGCNREQATWYHHEVLDMLLLCGLVGRANGDDFSEAYWEKLEKMIEFIASIMDVNGNVPMIGDSDGAVMIRFVPDHGFPVFHSLVATGSVLFDRADFAKKVGYLDDKSRWLLGEEEQKFTTLIKRKSLETERFPRDFPEGGYYILGKDLETRSEVRLIADAGPLGYLSIAAHGHADALSFVLSIGGQEILIDPGTFSYHTERKWRDYFKGTSAHNTIRIDGFDQSVSGGNFLWLKHAQAACELFKTSNGKDVFIGSHDGYQRLNDPVMHRREMILDKYSDRIEINDTLVCSKAHEVELFWHFSESCKAVIEEKTIYITNKHIQLSLKMADSCFLPQCYTGDEQVPLGWVSRKFDVKEPSPTIVWRGSIHHTVTLRTEINYQVNN